MKSVVKSSECPSELSKPIYFQFLPYEPQLEVAENGVILNYCNERPYVTVNTVYDCMTELTVNGVYLHQELIEVIFD